MNANATIQNSRRTRTDLESQLDNFRESRSRSKSNQRNETEGKSKQDLTTPATQLQKRSKHHIPSIPIQISN